MHMRRTALLAVMMATAVGVGTLMAQPTGRPSAAVANDTRPRHAALLNGLAPVSDDMLLHPSNDDWMMWRRTYDGWGYSPLDQVNRDNVKNLRLVWGWALKNGASETTPLVYKGVLFVHNNGDRIDALDAATGDLLWEYSRKLSPEILATNSI